MNPKSVFQKTEKGRDEISKRTHRLEARKRMLLIVVDGQSDAETLAAKVAHLDNAMDLLQALSADGFVEQIGGPEPASPRANGASRAEAPAPAAAGSPAAPPPASLPLEVLKRTAVVQIDKLMGPEGEALALNIEATATREAFFVEARKVHQALGSILGSRKAEAFAKALGL